MDLGQRCIFHFRLMRQFSHSNEIACFPHLSWNKVFQGSLKNGEIMFQTFYIFFHIIFCYVLVKYHITKCWKCPCFSENFIQFLKYISYYIDVDDLSHGNHSHAVIMLSNFSTNTNSIINCRISILLNSMWIYFSSVKHSNHVPSINCS